MSIKVFAKKAYEFNSPKGERAVTVPLGICPLPDWAREDPMFKAAQATGNIEIISSKEQEKRAENGDPNPELVELRALAVELGVPRANQMGVDKLKAAIAEKQKGGGDKTLGEMNLAELTECAAKNSIDITGLTTEDEIRARIKESAPKE